MKKIGTERDLKSVALALIDSGASLSSLERQCCHDLTPSQDTQLVEEVRKSIANGHDPLGVTFSKIRTPQVRRAAGATYTPKSIIAAMISWAVNESSPVRIVDPGAGSGRFLLAASNKFPVAQLVGIELDPLAALLLRANVAVRGSADRTKIYVSDYRATILPEIQGSTLFIGNPPYVRHHKIEPKWKAWFAETAKKFSIDASKLAGLHIHFFFRTMQLAKSGDLGVFITSAEWLDVNYGSALRHLLVDGLGGTALHVIDPKTMPFADATTTGAIICFRVGKRPNAFKVRSVEKLNQLGNLASGTLVSWDKVKKANRWSTIVRAGKPIPNGYIELGEICRVHRGQVTGSNNVWIAGDHAVGLPEDVLIPTVTKARDIIEAGVILKDDARLRRVVNLPADLDELSFDVIPSVRRFLNWAKKQGADKTYIAQHRRAWWSVGLKSPAPIVCTYMARRPPVFVRNLCMARHINIAHGLYPRDPMSNDLLNALTGWLRINVSEENGRSYAGGLIKFEPKELERVPVPMLENLPA